MNGIDLSAIVAAYAAIVATGALVLEIRRWFESGVILKATYMADATIFPREDDTKYIVLTVFKLGTFPTTLTHFGFEVYPTAWRRLTKKATRNLLANSSSSAHPLPFKLDAGEQLMGMVRKTDEVESLLQDGVLTAVVYGTHHDKPLRIRVRAPRPPEGKQLPA